jgi:hypothetical protein
MEKKLLSIISSNDEVRKMPVLNLAKRSLKVKEVSGFHDPNRMENSMAKFLENGTFSDLTVVCEGKEIPCHKTILAARSEVFFKMFEVRRK